MKKILSLILAVALVVVQLGAFAAADDVVLLSKNFDDTENGYGEFTNSWGYDKYELSQAMTGAGIWKVKYDVYFKGELSASSATYRSGVWLTKHTGTDTHAANAGCWETLSLLTLDGTPTFFTAKTNAITGITAATDKWYTVEFVVSKKADIGSAKVRITEKENPENTATQLVSLKAEGYGGAASGDYAAFGVTQIGTSINLDNVEISTAKDCLLFDMFNSAGGSEGYKTFTNSWGLDKIALSSAMTGTGVWDASFDVLFTGTPRTDDYQSGVWLIGHSRTDTHTNPAEAVEMIGFNGKTTKFFAVQEAVDGVTANLDTWYNVKFKLTKGASSGKGTLTITQKDNPSNTITKTVDLASWRLANYHSLGVTQIGTTVQLDNVEIKVGYASPEVGAVKLVNANGTEQAVFNNTVKAVAIEFTQEMNEASLENAVSVNDVAVSGTLSADKKIYTVETGVFNVGDTVKVDVAGTVKSVHNEVMGGAVSNTYIVSDAGVAFNKNFDNNQTGHNKIDGGAEAGMLSAADGYFSLNAGTAAFANVLWFINPSAVGGKYKVTFDVNFASEIKHASYKNIRIGKRSSDGDAYGGNDLLTFKEGKLYQGNTVVLDNAATNIWYTYEATIDGTTTSVKIKERDTVGAEWSTPVAGTIVEMPEVNTFWVGHGDLSLDNIVISAMPTAPVISAGSVTLKDADGNAVAKAEASVGIKSIDISFGQEIMKGSMAGISLKTGETLVAFDGVPSVDNTAYTLSNLTLEPGKEYTLTVGGLVNLFNQTQAGSFVYTFKTEKEGVAVTLTAIKNGENTVDELSGLAGELNIEMNVKNTATDPETAILFIAYYKGSRLAKIDPISMTFTVGENGVRNQPYTFAQPEGCDKVKIMLWDSVENIVPLSGFLTVSAAQ